MAKPGPTSTPGQPGGSRSDATRQALVEAAIESLRVDGFSGASARAIAARAGSTTGLVFYHFGSVAELLLAALDDVSARRLQRYDAAVEAVGSPSELVAAAAQIFREDLDEGYVTVLVEMIAGASSSPELGEQVAARIAPWRTFAERAIERTLADSPLASLVPVGDAAYAVVALYLGLEMLSHLDGDRTRALALFEQAGRLVRWSAACRSRAPSKETECTKTLIALVLAALWSMGLIVAATVVPFYQSSSASGSVSSSLGVVLADGHGRAANSCDQLVGRRSSREWARRPRWSSPSRCSRSGR